MYDIDVFIENCETNNDLASQTMSLQILFFV